MVSSCESADQVALAGPAKTTQMIIYYVKKCTKQGPCHQWRLVGTCVTALGKREIP